MEPGHPAKPSILVTSIVLLVFMVVGVPWNVVVLVTLANDKFYKEASSFLLFNLVLVDLLTCLLVMPFQAAPGLAGGQYKLGRSDYQLCLTCYAGVMLIICLLYVSIHLLALMSVDRLLYIIRPLHYHKTVTTLRIAVATIVIWLICVILVIPPLFEFGDIALSPNVGACTPLFSTYTRLGPAYYYFLFLVLEVLVPVGILIVSNIWLVTILCKNSKIRLQMTQVSISKRTSEINRQARSQYNMQQLRMVKMFGLIFISNMITWAPIIIAILAIAGKGTGNTPTAVFSFIYMCFLSQSIIHPMLESCLIGNVRQSLKKGICNCWKKSKIIQRETKST